MAAGDRRRHRYPKPARSPHHEMEAVLLMIVPSASGVVTCTTNCTVPAVARHQVAQVPGHDAAGLRAAARATHVRRVRGHGIGDDHGRRRLVAGDVVLQRVGDALARANGAGAGLVDRQLVIALNRGGHLIGRDRGKAAADGRVVGNDGAVRQRRKCISVRRTVTVRLSAVAIGFSASPKDLKRWTQTGSPHRPSRSPAASCAARPRSPLGCVHAPCSRWSPAWRHRRG